MRFEIVRLLRGEKAANSKEKEEEACVEQVNCAALYPLPHTGSRIFPKKEETARNISFFFWVN